MSCSVVRRVALPDAFLAADGLFQTFLTVLDGLRRLPRRGAPRARALPAVPHHHQGAHGRGARRRRPGDGARGDQGARGGRGARDAGAGRRRTTTCSTAWPPTPGCRSTARRSTALVGEPLVVRRHRRGPGARPSSTQVARGRGATPGRRGLPARADPLAALPFGERDAPSAPPVLRQGPGHLRRRRRPAPDGHLRPPLRLRRRARRADPAQGPRAHGDLGVLVRGRSATWPAATSCPPTSPTCPPAWPTADPDLAGRIMLCRKAEMLAIECIVRGYLSGSAWKEYRASGTMHGQALPGRAAGERPAPRAGVHAVHQERRARREHLLRAGGRPRGRRSWPPRRGTSRSSSTRGAPRWRASAGSSSPTRSSSSGWSTASSCSATR